MEKYINVMSQAIELSETVKEALQHTQKLIEDGQFEQSVLMFEECMKGYAQLDVSVRPVAEELEKAELIDVLDKLTRSAKLVVESFGKKDYQSVKEVLQFTLVPRFSQFQRLMTSSFEPLLIQ